MTTLRAGAFVALLAPLGACEPDRVCDQPDRVSGLPSRLSETGLYADIASDELATGVLAYTPRFPLWSDRTDERRWILLPVDTQFATSERRSRTRTCRPDSRTATSVSFGSFVGQPPFRELAVAIRLVKVLLSAMVGKHDGRFLDLRLVLRYWSSEIDWLRL